MTSHISLILMNFQAVDALTNTRGRGENIVLKVGWGKGVFKESMHKRIETTATCT